MSTEIDLQVLDKCLSSGGLPKRVLYLGARDRMALAVVQRHCGWVKTLDFDPALKPDILLDLNELKPQTAWEQIGFWNLIIAPYVLMYLEQPTTVLSALRRVSETLILQENVIRDRPDGDPWPDRNRFICNNAPKYTRILAEAIAKKTEKNLVWVCPKGNHYYGNDEGIGYGTSCLWGFSNDQL